MTVWVTRSQPGAQTTSQRLIEAGHTPLIAPLLTVRALAPPVDLDGFDALAFTSANAVRVFAGLEARRDRPVWTVGDATAQAARQAGFATVTSSHGDVAALGALLAKALPPHAKVLHPCAVERAGDLAAPLAAAGVGLAALAVYETAPAPQTPALLAAAAACSVVLLHSPKAARALNAVLDAQALRIARALCLSPAVAAALEARNFDTVAAAALPNDAALLKLL